MDPIETFVKKGGRFSLPLLVNSHSRLSLTQLSKGWISFEDILHSLLLSGQNISNSNANAHAALIFESTLVPALTHEGKVKLQLRKELIGRDDGFINNILNTLYSKCDGVELLPNIEIFKQEAMVYLKNYQIQDQAQSELDQQPNFGFEPRQWTKPSYREKSNFHGGNNNSNPNRYKLNYTADYENENQQTVLSRIEFEKSEPIVRLLAQVRKVGMDILFPQSTHDKILACIFVAIRSCSTPAHRELIDMVMAVKDSEKVSQLMHVSKTKIRGILALLKHGELLITQGAEGEPVRLLLAYGINSFKQLRERHDAFLSRYMLEHHLFIPAILKSELIWQFDEKTTEARLEAMDKLIYRLQFFFEGFTGTQPKEGEDLNKERTSDDIKISSSLSAEGLTDAQGMGSSDIDLLPGSNEAFEAPGKAAVEGSKSTSPAEAMYLSSHSSSGRDLTSTEDAHNSSGDLGYGGDLPGGGMFGRGNIPQGRSGAPYGGPNKMNDMSANMYMPSRGMSGGYGVAEGPDPIPFARKEYNPRGYEERSFHGGGGGRGSYYGSGGVGREGKFNRGGGSGYPNNNQYMNELFQQRHVMGAQKFPQQNYNRAGGGYQGRGGYGGNTGGRGGRDHPMTGVDGRAALGFHWQTETSSVPRKQQWTPPAAYGGRGSGFFDGPAGGRGAAPLNSQLNNRDIPGLYNFGESNNGLKGFGSTGSLDMNLPLPPSGGAGSLGGRRFETDGFCGFDGGASGLFNGFGDRNSGLFAGKGVDVGGFSKDDDSFLSNRFNGLDMSTSEHVGSGLLAGTKIEDIGEGGSPFGSSGGGFDFSSFGEGLRVADKGLSDEKGNSSLNPTADPFMALPPGFAGTQE